MRVSRTPDAANLLRFSPPELIGLSRKSPTTAPKGLVNTKATQNKSVLDILDQ